MFSPYRFYQFWLNVNDADAARYTKIFTTLTQEEIAHLEEEQAAAPHLRPLQKRLAEEITVLVHGRENYESAVAASGILFGQGTKEQLQSLDEATLLAVFEGVPQFEISKEKLQSGIKVVDLLTEEAAVLPSKGELRKLVAAGGLSIDKEKVASPDDLVTTAQLIADRYLLVQRGKKNYYLLIAR